MYAIVDIAGQQFKVEKDQKLFVHRLEGEEGKKVSFDHVLLIDSGSKISVGDPLVKGAEVSAKIISHVKADKVLVFKKKRRKGYQKLNGHRQYMTQIQIESISEVAATKPKAETQKAETQKAEAPVAEVKPGAEKKVAAPKAASPKAAAVKPPKDLKPEAKKPAAKKAAPKKESDQE